MRYKYLSLLFIIISCQNIDYKQRSRYTRSHRNVNGRNIERNNKKYSNKKSYEQEGYYSYENNSSYVNNNQYTTKRSYSENYSNDKKNKWDVKGNYTGYYKVGKPYKINGKTYYPKEYSSYKEIGLASWYGNDFHNKKTANGETFNMNEMTAAHKTLPLPSIVRVTNLENGKSVILRVNDRGPFVDNRVIDVSKEASKELEFKNKGLITVKVELLKKETENFLKKHNLK